MQQSDSWSGGSNKQNGINSIGSNGISSVSEYSNIIGSALGGTKKDNLNINNNDYSRSQPDFGFTNDIVSTYSYILFFFSIVSDEFALLKETGMPYDFSYDINENGNNYGHSETSDGNIVKGRYFVQLPDGRLQTVKIFHRRC